MATAGLGFAAVLLPLACLADEVFLKGGGQLSGRIVSQTATTVEVDVGAGRVGVPASSVLRIEKGHSALQEYEERAGHVAGGDTAGWLALGDWATARGLSSQAREAYQRALRASPSDPRANAAVGNVQVDGRWVSEEESYRQRGFVRFEGEWITPAEHEAILRDRAAEAEQVRQRDEADSRVRDAEARAQEAEARARKAESDAAEAQTSSDGLPLWYGWGAGPTVWPTGPIVTRPISPNRPVARPVTRR